MTKASRPLASPVPEAQAVLVLERLRARYPVLPTLLEHGSAFELLVATILAAQCTDARVNMVTPDLFRRWPTPKAMAAANLADVEEAVRSTGFYRNKAKNIIATARMIEEEHHGEVPHTLKELILLPGVARKTANVVLWGAFGINEGIAVDTHVKRIAFRLGLTDQTDPDRVERDLTRLFPQESWGDINHSMVWFGREVCDARKPRCESCDMLTFCPRRGV